MPRLRSQKIFAMLRCLVFNAVSPCVYIRDGGCTAFSRCFLFERFLNSAVFFVGEDIKTRERVGDVYTPVLTHNISSFLLLGKFFCIYFFWIVQSLGEKRELKKRMQGCNTARIQISSACFCYYTEICLATDFVVLLLHPELPYTIGRFLKCYVEKISPFTSLMLLSLFYCTLETEQLARNSKKPL